MSQARVVICDGDYGVLRALGDTLRAAGHRVSLAVDGRSGLARAVETSPDVIVVDRDIAIVDVRTFLELVRENPRTASAFVLVTGRGDPRHVPLDARMEAIPKPIDVDDVVRRIEELAGVREQVTAPAWFTEPPPAEPSRPAARGASSVAELEAPVARPSGSEVGAGAERAHPPSEVRLADVVQIFALRRRTGRIEVEDPRGRCEIMLHEGRITAARYGGVLGRRAAVWALAAARGEVRFVPNGGAAFDRDPDLEGDPAILLEQATRLGARLEALPSELRSLGAILSLGPAAPGPPNHPVARLLLALLGERPLSLRETLDRLGADEATSLATIGAMAAEGRVLVLPSAALPPRVPLASADVIETLASRLASLSRPWAVGPPRLLLLTAGKLDVEAIATSLRSIEGFTDRDAALVDLGGSTYGTAGTLGVGEAATLELFFLPLDASLRPLWPLAASPAVAGLILASSARPASSDTVEAFRSLTGSFVLESRDDWHDPTRLAALIREAIGTG